MIKEPDFHAMILECIAGQLNTDPNNMQPLDGKICHCCDFRLYCEVVCMPALKESHGLSDEVWSQDDASPIVIT